MKKQTNKQLLPDSHIRFGSHTDLGEVELQGVVSGKGDYEASGKVLWQWVPVVAEEQAVIAERRHGDTDLCQVVEVLQHRCLWGGRQSRCSAATLTTHTGRVLPLLRSHLPEEQPVGDVL